MNILFIIGFLASVIWIYNFLSFVYKFFIAKLCDLYKRYEGGWAIVTGSTDGLGLKYCILLAKRGFNIISISRN